MCDTCEMALEKVRRASKFAQGSSRVTVPIRLQIFASDGEHKTHHSNPKELQCGICLGANLTQKEFDDHLCITYRENYICCNRDFKYQSFYNKHMLLAHGEHTNVRVKPTDGLLIGQFRAMRRQEIRCPNCAQEFPTR
ncbi:uncharacterized protein LOC131294599 [Anopheles ziemanni]|uniref:uncharacterized protein LOC131265210 n=1 Tax=Anopheles coustani TaxID=139045 RepID=UPI00265A8D6D|nr:uncharacterized protein LOC131265210 [Anopheles coustani]XP_058178628.1 uncharacterized protein LOC131294599 [Anopheles ziemanni]